MLVLGCRINQNVQLTPETGEPIFMRVIGISTANTLIYIESNKEFKEGNTLTRGKKVALRAGQSFIITTLSKEQIKITSINNKNKFGFEAEKNFKINRL